jgi:putative spermidine/putrescine transport system substrate-binding protein
MKLILGCILGTLALLTACNGSHPNSHQTLVVVSYGGGTYEQSQIDSFEHPFAFLRKVNVEPVVWGADFGRLQEMVRSSNVPWDVVEVTAAQFSRGTQENLYQPLTTSLPSGSFEPRDTRAAPTPYGVPSVYWSTVLAYRKNAFPKGAPTSWRDFWDVKRFPGPRALYDNPRGTLEFALLASGVDPKHLYPLDVDRAFAMLDKIRPYVRIWWTDGTQPVNALLTGTVVISSAWSGRIFASEQARERITYTWNEAAHELDYWVIPRGSKNADLATDFIIFASSPEAMAHQAAATGYGPANMLAMSSIPQQTRTALPTEPNNWAVSFVIDSVWWSKHEDEITRRWLLWKSK